MVKGLNEFGLSRDNNVKVNINSGYNSEDMLDVVQPVLRRKPDLVVIHSGTNDITQNVNSYKKIKKLINNFENSDVKIVISGIINREDHVDYTDIIAITNDKLKNLCGRRNIAFLDNSNIGSNCLNRSRLHLNNYGDKVFASNLLSVFSKFD